MMSVVEWKKINLFTLASFRNGKTLRNIKSEITSFCSDFKQRIFCDSHGYVHVFFSNWESISFQTSFNTINFCAISNNILIVASQKKAKDDILLKLYNLQKLTKRDGALCVGSVKLNTLSKATCMRTYFTEGAHLLIALGLESGDLLLHRAPLKEISSNFRIIHFGTGPIIGIEIRLRCASTKYDIFAASDKGVFCYTMDTNSSIPETLTVLDSSTKRSRCCALKPGSEDFFIVGRDDAVYCFTNDGRGPCYAIESRKEHIAWCGNNLIVLSTIQRQPFSFNSTSLVVFDVKNKIITLSKEIDSVAILLVETDACYIITKTNDVLILRERDMQSKLRLLLDKNLYDITLRILSETDNNDAATGLVHMQYGDHLLSKGDVNRAIKQYISSIGFVEPFHIIRKLLFSRYNTQLANYLKELECAGFATEEHMKLLRNCTEREDLPVKIDRICKTSKNIKISKAHETNLVKIFDDYDNEKIFECFANMTENDICSFFMEHSELMKTHYATKLMCVLKKIFCMTSFVERKFDAMRLIPLIINSEAKYSIDFLQSIIQNKNGSCEAAIYSYLLELYLIEWKKGLIPSNEILEYVKNNSNHMRSDQTLILFRIYSFEDVIKHSQFHRLPAQKLELSRSGYDGEELSKTWLNSFSKNEVIRLLECFRKIAVKENFLIDQINDTINQEHFLKLDKPYKQYEIINHLFHDLHSLNYIVSCFTSNPIEFRSSVCDMCRQQLKLPAIHYLCQHSFHQDCVNDYNYCVACEASRKEKSRDHDFSDIHILDAATISEGIIKQIATTFSHGIFNKRPFPDNAVSTCDQWPGRFRTMSNIVSTNPFEEKSVTSVMNKNPFEEYDTNLNPFDNVM